VAGLCSPDSGEVVVLGGSPRSDMAWADLALVPQVLALSVELSIGENVAACAPESRHPRVGELLRRRDVIGLAGRAVAAVSMGQQHRAAVARALVGNPRVLLADDPTSFQDDLHTHIVVNALRHAADRGTGV